MEITELSHAQLIEQLQQREKQLQECELMRMALQATQQRLNQIVKATPIGICVLDEGGYFEQINPAFADLYGYSADELIGRHFSMVLPPTDRATFDEDHAAFIASGIAERHEQQALHKQGEGFTILTEAARISGADGRLKKALFVIDISEKKRFESELVQANAQLNQLARTDSLTGLLNHGVILQNLEQEVQRCQLEERPLTLLLMDLDNFKQINDRYGHPMGDEVLQRVAKTLLEGLREFEQLGRYGGEEFIAFLSGCHRQRAIALADQLRQRVAQIGYGDGEQITLSIGLAFLTDQDAGSLVAEADQQLYRAKQNGKDCVCYADSDE